MELNTILSLRGGGVRGCLTACALVKLESQLGGLVRDHITMVAGTSTGALLAAGIAAGIPATDLLAVYTDRAAEIFQPSGLIGDVDFIAKGHKCDIANLNRVLVEVFGSQAGLLINDCPIRVMLVATAMNGHNWFFVRDNPRNAQTTGKVKLLDAATASAAAPTVFQPWQITEGLPTPAYFADGGTGGQANPVYQACVEAFEFDDLFPSYGGCLSAGTRVIELGTGFFPDTSAVPPKGLLSTVEWVISDLLDASEDEADAAARLQWPGILQVFNIQLPSNISESDVSAIPQLVTLGNQMAAGMDWTKILA